MARERAELLAAITGSDRAQVLAAIAEVDASDDDLVVEVACLFESPVFEKRSHRSALFDAVRRVLWSTRDDAAFWSRDAAWMTLEPFVETDPQFASDLAGAVLLGAPDHDRALAAFVRVAVVHDYLHRGTDLPIVARAATDPARRAELLAYDGCLWEIVTGEPDHQHGARAIAEARAADPAVDVDAIRARCLAFRPLAD